MKNYYHILGVHKTAQQSEIKHAYRRLVQQLHPDINPDPAAQELIKEVNEAYTVIGDEVKRREYDYRFDNPFSVVEVEQTTPHRDPAYHRRSRQPSAKPSGPTQQEMMVKVLTYLKPVTWVALPVCLLLIVDFCVPRIQKTETIKTLRTQAFRRDWQGYLITQEGREMKISSTDLSHFATGKEIIFTESRLLSILIRIQTTDGSIHITNLATLYSNFIFVPVLLLVISIITMARFGSVEFTLNLALVNTILLIFTLILMFT